MSATGTFAKKAEDHIPYCRDQGLPYLAAAARAGTSIQSKTFVQIGSGLFAFEAEDLSPMADGDYQVLMHNQSGIGAPDPWTQYPTATSKTPAGFVISGAAAGNVIDVVIVGRLKGQL
jgi:hypothetical protein